jgi:alpha-beta hydrolase superfamily lysophospholipase
VLVWGHSQGAAIAAHMVARERAGVERLLLESPYSSLADQVAATTGWGLRLIIGLVGLNRVDMEFK